MSYVYFFTDEKQKQELRFEQYVTNRLKKHIIFDSHVEEQIRECYRIRFLLMNELNKNFEKKKTKGEFEFYVFSRFDH